jgi:hypothetical protein
LTALFARVLVFKFWRTHASFLQWRAPMMVWLACAALVAVSVALFFFPLNRVLLMLGVYRFIKKFHKRYLRRATGESRGFNELVEFVSRAPNDAELRALLATHLVQN